MAGRRRSVLVVDDDKVMAEQIVDSLALEYCVRAPG